MDSALSVCYPDSVPPAEGRYKAFDDLVPEVRDAVVLDLQITHHGHVCQRLGEGDDRVVLNADAFHEAATKLGPVEQRGLAGPRLVGELLLHPSAERLQEPVELLAAAVALRQGVALTADADTSGDEFAKAVAVWVAASALAVSQPVGESEVGPGRPVGVQQLLLARNQPGAGWVVGRP